MFNAIARFIGYTLAVAFLGVLTFSLSYVFAPDHGQPTGYSWIFILIGILMIFGSPAIVGIWLWQKRQNINAKIRMEASEALVLQHKFFERERLIDAVDQHRTALARNINRAIRKNDYGAIVEDRQNEALFEFFASINLDVTSIRPDEAAEVVYEQLASYDEHDRQSGFDPQNLPFDGHAFEQWVASALFGFGWDAEVTMASGDQGIDVIASKGGHKIGLQCKLYSSAIGNKAIQEAYAGKAFYGVDRVAVISNADYTSSAKSLASATGVLLFSHHDIPKIYEIAFPK